MRVDLAPDFGGGFSPPDVLAIAKGGESLVACTRLAPEGILLAASLPGGCALIRGHFGQPYEVQRAQLCDFLANTRCQSSSVIDALRRTPRELLVPDASRALAWWNGANCGPGSVTVFSPWLAAYCAVALDVRRGDSVMVMGYGGGFTTALFAHLVGPTGRITAVELNGAIASAGQKTMRSLGLSHVRVLQANALTVTSHVKFDRLFTTLAVASVPESWKGLIAPDGIIGAFEQDHPADDRACSFQVREARSLKAVRRMSGIINSPFDAAPRASPISDYPDLVTLQARCLAIIEQEVPE